MKLALITGASGYVGATIAALLLQNNYRLLCLARGESGRVRKKVMETCAGFCWPVPEHLDERIIETGWDPAQLENNPLMQEVSLVIHSAAEMSFSPLRMVESFDFNLIGTMSLYETVTKACSRRPRFFYISTAYTGGAGLETYHEDLHVTPRILNPYQATKWSAEMALFLRSKQAHALPTCIFRPTVVVGHSKTGWYGGNSFGLYSYIDSAYACKKAGASSARFNIDPEVAHDYLFIDTLLTDVETLLKHDTAAFSVVHSTGTCNSNAWRMERIGKWFGLSLSFGAPETKADRIANRATQFNEPFNTQGLKWNFETRHVAQVSGQPRTVVPMNDETFTRLLDWYTANALDMSAPGLAT